MRIGYCRVSTGEQSMDLQIDALTKAGCTQIFQDVMSGAIDNRPGLLKALAALRRGDTLTVWRLDRLGRSLRHLVATITELRAMGAEFCSVTEAINTTDAGSRLVFGIFASLAEFERDLIRQRTMAGLAAARARGRLGGRPPKLNAEKIEAARQLLQDSSMTVSQIARSVGVSRTTIHRIFNQSGNIRDKST